LEKRIDMKVHPDTSKALTEALRHWVLNDGAGLEYLRTIVREAIEGEPKIPGEPAGEIGRMLARHRIERDFIDSIPPEVEGVYLNLLATALQLVDWTYLVSVILETEERT